MQAIEWGGVASQLLLLSSSRVFGGGHFEYARDVLRDFLAGCDTLHFAPFAIADQDGYAATVSQTFAALGIEIVPLHRVDARRALESARALYVGGGNSFRLLKRLHELDVIELVRRRVTQGELLYLGASAGSNMACPSLRTTNDMPIVQPRAFTAFGLVPFQINPHYVEPAPDSSHMGETRDDRLREFLEENDVNVVGLREGAWLRMYAGQRLMLEGIAAARVFRRGQETVDLEPGTDVSWLLQQQPRFDQPATGEL